jgi:diguanylate cyclase (GGDEF)-like protein
MLRAQTTPHGDVRHRYRVLLDISRIIAGTHEPGELYRTIYEQASRVIETTGFYISLYDPHRDTGTVVFLADRGRTWEPDVTYRGTDSRAIREAGPILESLCRPSGDSRRLKADDEDNVTRSTMAAPIVRDETVLGVISAQSYRPGAYEPSDLELLVAIADLAGVAIANARAMAELDRQRQEERQLEEVGRALSASLDVSQVLGEVTARTLELTGADGAGVWLIGSDGGTEVAATAGDPMLPVGTAIPLPEPVRRGFIDDRQPLVLDRDLAAQILNRKTMKSFRGQTALAVPLLNDGELLGVLTESRLQDHAYDPEQVQLLERLALRAASALSNARLHAQIRLLSLTDPLTGLPNRRHMDIFLEKEFAAAVRGRPLSLAMFDLNDFKRYNDTAGHQAGDDILCRFANLLQTHIRAMNLAARYGGDEFVVILSDTSPEGAQAFADRIVAQVRADAAMAGVGASAGIAGFDLAMTRPDDLVRAADEALYQAKSERAYQPQVDR